MDAAVSRLAQKRSTKPEDRLCEPADADVPAGAGRLRRQKPKTRIRPSWTAFDRRRPGMRKQPPKTVAIPVAEATAEAETGESAPEAPPGQCRAAAQRPSGCRSARCIEPSKTHAESSAERNAFREIAKALGARIAGEDETSPASRACRQQRRCACGKRTLKRGEGGATPSQRPQLRRRPRRRNGRQRVAECPCRDPARPPADRGARQSRR